MTLYFLSIKFKGQPLTKQMNLINRFNPATSLCLSQPRTWISNVIRHMLLIVQSQRPPFLPTGTKMYMIYCLHASSFRQNCMLNCSSNNKTLNARLLSAETQVCHRSYIIAASSTGLTVMNFSSTGFESILRNQLNQKIS
jgi:hypothetical protein